MTTPDNTPGRPIRFGSRGSALALAQTELALARFRDTFPELPTELVIVRTEGDVDRRSPLSDIGGRGVFTSAIEERILNGAVDAAVHSAKDLPTTLHPEAPIVAMPDRDDPRDVLVSRHNTTLASLPANPIIGTSSRRREVQILRLRPDAQLVNIRGNIDTRLRKSQGEEFDAIVLAAAGLARLGWCDRISQYFTIDELIPSPGQGAIAIQAWAGSAAAKFVSAIDDPRVSSAVNLERVFLASIGAGCSHPIGAFVSEQSGRFRLIAMLADATGSRIAAADEFLAAGDEMRHVADIACRLKAEIDPPHQSGSWEGWSANAGDLAGLRVAVTRPRRQAGQLMAVLSGRGAEPVSLPTIRVEPLPDTAELDGALRAAANGDYDWIAFTSANAVEAVVNRLSDLEIAATQFADVRIAAIGPATARVVGEAGLNVTLVPDEASAEALATQMLAAIESGARILYPRSAIGRDTLPDALRGAGLNVDVIDAYQTLPEPDIDPGVLDQIRQGAIDAIAFTSPSSIENLLFLLGDDREVVARVPAICAGLVTAKAAREAGLIVAVVSVDPGATAIADAVAQHWRRGVSAPESPFAKQAFVGTQDR
jgi:hydroxymethylbilane synthase